MDKKKLIRTFIKEGYSTVDILFITGKITGMAFAICEYEPGYKLTRAEKGGYVFEKQFTHEQYENFKKVIEKFYPGLCIFKY